ncbi:MAG TPA: phosphoenolpyruvate--protein phosphotransferase [Polyangiaceae bacterium]|nr:phosphoenolpyruvate--protein phosphotransferase [Polyangiaceae bacterium]
MTSLSLAAPVSGWATPLEEVPDPVFAHKMVGDGIAIDPTSSELRAPCDGVVVSLHEAHHACIVRCDQGVEVLLHIGIDTVGLRGEGFAPLTRAGQSVRTGDPLIAFDMDLLARKARGLFTLMIVVNADAYVIAQRVQGRAVAVGEPLLALTGIAAAVPSEIVGETVERTAIVRMAHGLHARPAAVLADRARQHAGLVRIARQDRSANGKSVVSLMTLGARNGDALTITVQGGQAARVAQELADLVMGGTRDGGEPVVASPALADDAGLAPVEAPPFLPDKEVVFRGTTAVPGLVEGYAVRAIRTQSAIPRDGAGVAEESQCLAGAIVGVRRDLEAVLDALPHDGAEAAILRVHLSLLADPEIMDAARGAIERGRSAAWAWQAAVQRYAGILSGLDDPLLAERAADLRDIESRVVAFLTRTSASQVSTTLPPSAILIADELRPSDLVAGAAGRWVAVCAARGGPTSHGAILAASMGIPAVVALGDAVLRVPDGAPVIVDGDRGEVRVFPGEGARRATVDETFRRAARREANLALRHRGGRTKDGVRIEVLANLARPGDAADAIAHGAEGCGLLRTEFLFLHRSSAPSADEQAAQYQEIADTLAGRPLVIRTLDIGGDKALAYLPTPTDENPALGLRGIRFALRHPDLLRTQVRAILQIKAAAPVRILLPMVSCSAELRVVRALVETERRALGSGQRVALGAMIEVPIAAVSTDVLAREVDFISIGTNDLTQYGAAADRGNPRVAPFLDSLHPGVLRLVAQAVAGARLQKRPVAVCGGIASDPRSVALLIGLGVTEISAASLVIPDLKAFIATLTLPVCTEVARKTLDLSSADEVRALLNRTWPVI